MNVKPTFEHPRLVTSFIAATLAPIIALGILAAVTGLFQSRGAPMEGLLAAERACTEHSYVSEREACVHQRLASAYSPSIAGK